MRWPATGVVSSRNSTASAALTQVAVSPADLELVRGAVSKTSLPVWAEVCDKSNPGCSQKWTAAVGPVLGLK